MDAQWRQRVINLADDQALMAWLDDCATLRLGRYFEALYRVWCERVLGWRVLASNLPIRRHSHTLGELDIVVENPLLNRVEHHEVAVKFYLGISTPMGVRWLGPNRRDRLDLKVGRMREHQMTLAQTPEATQTLASQNLAKPVVSRLVMLGQLFVPHAVAESSVQSDASSLPVCSDAFAEVLPSTDNKTVVPFDLGEEMRAVLARLPICYWHRAHTVARANLVNSVVLAKADWLGTLPPMAHPTFVNAQVLVDSVELNQRAEMVARLTQTTNGLWMEVERFFLVPKYWPDKLP